jgi:hypothetical protein
MLILVIPNTTGRRRRRTLLLLVFLAVKIVIILGFQQVSEDCFCERDLFGLFASQLYK